MIAAFDRHEHRQSETDLVLIDQRDLAFDDAIGLQALNPLLARRRGQADTLANFGDRQRRILLQHRQDLAIDGVDTP